MKDITRRNFIGLSAGTLASLGLAGCSSSTGTSNNASAPSASQSAVTLSAATTGAVKLGIDNLQNDFGVLANKKVGLITNATGVDSTSTAQSTSCTIM